MPWAIEVITGWDEFEFWQIWDIWDNVGKPIMNHPPNHHKYIIRWYKPFPNGCFTHMIWDILPIFSDHWPLVFSLRCEVWIRRRSHRPKWDRQVLFFRSSCLATTCGTYHFGHPHGYVFLFHTNGNFVIFLLCFDILHLYGLKSQTESPDGLDWSICTIRGDTFVSALSASPQSQS